MIVHQRVRDLAAAARPADHPGAAQHSQVLGDQRLGCAQLLHELVHAALAHAELGDDRDADRRGEGAQQLPGRLVGLVTGRRRHRSRQFIAQPCRTTSGGSTSAGWWARFLAARTSPPPSEIATNAPSARSTVVAPGAVSISAETATPAPAAPRPITMASAMVLRKPRVTCWAAATGTTINAETRSNPTVRMAIVTVTAVVTAIRTFSVRTGRPLTRAYSSSLQTANRAGRNAVIASSTARPSTMITMRSCGDVVISEPNRYCIRFALLLSSESPTST